MKALCLFVIVLGMLVQASAQALPVDASSYRDFSWMAERWTGDESTYKSVSDDLRLIFGKAELIEHNYDVYRSYALSNPKNPMAQFKWGFFLMLGGSAQRLNFGARHTSFDSELKKVWNQIQAVASPKTRPFARLRFIVEYQISPRLEFVPIAKRLYESDKEDDQIAYRYADLLAWTKPIENKKLALEIAQHLLKGNPKSSHYNGLLGKCYMYVWESTHSADDVKNAINYYNLSAQYSSDEDWKKQVKLIVADLKKRSK